MKLNFFVLLSVILMSTSCSYFEDTKLGRWMASDISPAFGEGVAPGDLRWEVRFNMPDCNHPGKKKGAWCKQSDSKKAAKKSGVEDRLKSWINDPNVKSLHLAYFSFSNSAVKKALCEGLKKRPDLFMTIYMNYDTVDYARSYFKKCSKTNVKVYSRGVGPFGTPGAHLQHSKIFLASEMKELKPLAYYTPGEKQMYTKALESRIRFTSSSANMSSFGTNIYFENWLFLDAPADDYIAQQNVCAFQAYSVGQGLDEAGESVDDRNSFSREYYRCVKATEKKMKIKPRKDISFYLVPSNKMPKPYTAMGKVVRGAKKEVLMAIHRLGTSYVSKKLLKSVSGLVDVKIIFDDDTLRVGKKQGGPAFDVGPNDVLNYRALRNCSDVYFMETNACANAKCKAQLFHNKFIVTDRSLFQGAGNFTATALNIYGVGNYEQFYKIDIPEIVQVYRRAWYELKRRATRQDLHESFDNQDRKIVKQGGWATFVD